MGGATRFGQRADGEPRLLRRAFLRRRQRPVHHSDHLLCLQCHTCRWDSSSEFPLHMLIIHLHPLSHNEEPCKNLTFILVVSFLASLSNTDPPPSCSPGCQVELFPCERKTLETVKELQGNFMCWKGSKGYSPYTSLCPFYRQVYMDA